jgi:glycosyltransferase involved in cell wall biosynthesis
LAQEVIRIGLIPQPGWLFKLADASILTSKSEGLARVLIESFLCGTPAFSYPLDGLSDVYGKELESFVASHREAADLAEKIHSALADESEMRARTAGLKQMLEVRHSVQSHVLALQRAVRFG